MAVKQAQKFTEEELTTLKTIQSKSQEATLKCGQLYLSKLRLEAQEKFLQNQIQELEQQEELWSELKELLSIKNPEELENFVKNFKE